MKPTLPQIASCLIGYLCMFALALFVGAAFALAV